MATSTVTISNVRLEGTNALVPGSIVGADPWNDANAGTYTENTQSDRVAPASGDGGFEVAVGDLSLPVEVGTLTAITLEADLTPTNAGDTGVLEPQHGTSVALHDASGEHVTFFSGEPQALAGDVMETVTSSTTSLGTDPADLTEFLLPALSGGTVRVTRFSNSDGGVPADYTIRTHRLVLTIDYEPALTIAPVTRLYPRTDGRGLSSATRVVGNIPPERIFPRHM